MSIIKFISLLVVIMVFSSLSLPITIALASSQSLTAKYYDIETTKKSFGILVSAEKDRSTEVINELIQELLANASSVLANTGDELVRIKPFLVNAEEGKVVEYYDYEKRLGGSFPVPSIDDSVNSFIPVTFRLTVKINASSFSNDIHMHVILLSVYVSNDDKKVWHVAEMRKQKSEGDMKIESYYKLFVKNLTGKGELTISWDDIPLTNFLYGITLYNDVKDDKLYIYFNLTDVNVIFRPVSNPKGRRLLSIKASEASINFVESDNLWNYIATFLNDTYSMFKSQASASLLSKVSAEYSDRLEELLNDYFMDLDQKYYGFVNSIRTFKIMSKGIVDKIDVGFSASVTVRDFKVINETENDPDKKTLYQKDSISSGIISDSKTLSRNNYNIGGYSEDEVKDLLYDIISSVLVNTANYVNTTSVQVYENVSGSRETFSWYTFPWNIRGKELRFARSAGVANLDKAYLLTYTKAYYSNFNPSDLIRLSETSNYKLNQCAFVLINPYPFKDPDIFNNNTFDDTQRTFIDLSVKGDKLSSASAYNLLKLYIEYKNGSTWDLFTNMYTRTIEHSDLYVRYANRGNYVERYEAQISGNVIIVINIKYADYKADLIYRKLLEEVEIDINVGKLDFSTERAKDEAEKHPPVGDITIIPGLAPIKYDGIPTKVHNLIDYFNSDLADEYANLKQQITDNMIYQLVSKALFPTFLPVPLPERAGTRVNLGLNKFAPGEYLGGYAFVKSEIDLSGSSTLIRRTPGVSLATIYIEEVVVKYEGSKGVMRITPSGPQYTPDQKEIRLLTIGIGIGKPGSKIGHRFYVFPSAYVDEGMFNEDDSSFTKQIRDSLLSNDIVKGIIVKLGEILGVDNMDKYIDDLFTHGAYLNFLTYLGDKENRNWIYIPFTIKDTSRFVVGEPGKLQVYVEDIRIFHIKIFKVPIIGVPVPLPVPLYWYDAPNNRTPDSYGETYIDVHDIAVLPISVARDEVSLAKYKGLPPRTAIEKAMVDNGISIYAIPVWIDDEGMPIGPVLLRGPYGISSISSLGVALVDKSTGKVLGHSRVNDLGFSLESIKVSYAELRRLGANATVSLVPIWYSSNSLVKASNDGDYPFYDTLYVFPPSLTIIHRFDGDNFLVYIGAWHNIIMGGKQTQEFLNKVKAKIDEYYGIYENISSMITRSINRSYNMFKQQLDHYRDPQSFIDDLEDVFNDIINDILQQALSTLVDRIVTEVATTIIAAAAPDPTGGIITGLIQELVTNIINEITDSLNAESDLDLDEIIGNLTDVLSRYALMYVLAQVIDYIESDGYYSMLDMIEKFVSQVTQKIFDAIETANQTVKNITNVLYFVIASLEKYAHYYPAFFTRVRAYDPRTLEEMYSRGILSDRFMLPLDKLYIRGAGEHGAIVVVEPYNVQELLLNEIGELLGIKVLSEMRGQIVFWGLLMAIGGWSYYIGEVANIEDLCNFTKSLYSISIKVLHIVRNKIGLWITVYGLDLDLYYPTIKYILPVKI